jgi:hypothetical protein
MGCSTKYASAWMNCAPNKKKGTHLDNQSLGLILKYWMGVPIFAERVKCHCNASLDIYGDHAMHCKKSNHITKRHDHVRDILYRFLQISSVQVEKELVGYKAGEKSRVGDLILPFGGNGLNTDTECLYDVSIYSSLYSERLHNSSKVRESAAEQAVRAKLTARRANQDGIIDTALGPRKFIPLGFEALGGFSKNSQTLVDFIASEWSMKSGLQKSTAKNLIITKISMGIQRGNARGLALVASIVLTHNIDNVAVAFPG